MTTGSDSQGVDRVGRTQVDPNQKPGVDQEKRAQPQPTLSAYFGEKRIPAAKFIKAVRTARLARFEESDSSAALKLTQENDPYAERLWKLMSHGSLPGPINTWIWGGAQEHLARVFGTGVDLASHTPEQIVASVRRRFPALAASPDNAEKKAFLFSTRILAIWLLQRRRIPVSEIVRSFSSLICKNQQSATQVALAAVRAGSKREFDVAMAVSLLGRSTIEDSERERDRARAETSNLRENLERKLAENSELRAAIGDLHREKGQLSANLRDLQAQLDMERQHAGYDFAELKGNHAVLLREHLSPLIQDAIDALEIASPAPDLALSRLKRAASTIAESLS